MSTSLSESAAEVGSTFAVSDARTGWMGGVSLGLDSRQVGLNGDLLISRQGVFERSGQGGEQLYEFASVEASAGFRANFGGWNTSLQGLYAGFGLGVASRFNATITNYSGNPDGAVAGWTNVTAVFTGGFTRRRFLIEGRYAIDLTEFPPAPPGDTVKKLWHIGVLFGYRIK